MRKILLLSLLVPLMLFGAARADEQYPVRPINFVVPFPAGGATDLAARTLAKHLTKNLGVSVVVQNKAGASGVVGTQFVAHAKPDGYTLLLGASGTLATNPWLYKNLPYSPERSFEPVGVFSESPLVLVVGKSHGFRSLKQLLDYTREHPGKINFGTAGPGSAMNLTSQLLQRITKTKMTQVPFKGAADAMTALLSGTIDLMFDYAVTVTPQVHSGSIAALATTAKSRLSRLPNVPTFTELGYPDISLRAWFGLLVPAGTPHNVVARLETALQKTLSDPEFKAPIESQGSVAVEGVTGRAFADFIKSEKQRWKDLIKAAGIVPQ
ncbi:Bug family tripartite tricarboxylate transporter substrate binding protein [Candidimonas nitroreducens]|nr:tripartite tricarboxylate transporter substrate binding protein [Candidimonas nitroreducens]